MLEMSTLDLLLFAVAAYLAVITLVRLMRRRRESIINDLAKELEVEQKRLKAERKNDKRQKIREQMGQPQRRRRGAA